MAIYDVNEMMFTAFEPKLQNRFIMDIDGIPGYLVKKISRPSKKRARRRGAACTGFFRF